MTFEEKIIYVEQKLRDYIENLGYQYNSRFVDHLIGTSAILAKYGAPSYLIDAGLFHSVYGTSYFKEKMTIDRDVVCKLIGNDAEELVYIFCNLQHPRLENIMAIEDETIKKSLLYIHQANVDDVNRRMRIAREQDSPV